MLKDLIDLDIDKPLTGTVYFRVWAKWCGHCTNMKGKDPELHAALSKHRKDIEIYDIEDTLYTHMLNKHPDHPFMLSLSQSKISIQAYPTALKWENGRFSTIEISDIPVTYS